MPYEFRAAKRENVTLILGVAGPSGGGKTYSALRLAKGLSGGKRFAVIDTEARRALHYADQFEFDHVDLLPPFKPSAFEGAIKAAGSYPVVVVDNFSHEWAGEGGILDWQEAELEESVKRALGRQGETRAEWQLRESFKMAAWIKPKTEHKHMVQRLLQSRAHLILCLRAEDKIDMVKGASGKMEIVPKQTLSGFKGWIPICEKNLLFELTASFILTPDKPGVPQPIKLQEQHRKIIDLTKPLDEESGARLAEWARGAARPATAPSTPAAAATVTTAHEADRGAAHQGVSAPGEGGAGAEQSGGNDPRSEGTRPQATVSNPKEPPKAGDEPARGPAAEDSVENLFAPATPKAAPAKTAIPGVDIPDERQQLEAAILAEKVKLERQPTAEVWDKICEDVCGTTVLSMADPSALADLLAVVKGLLTKDREAIARVKKIMAPAAA